MRGTLPPRHPRPYPYPCHLPSVQTGTDCRRRALTGTRGCIRWKRREQIDPIPGAPLGTWRAAADGVQVLGAALPAHGGHVGFVGHPRAPRNGLGKDFGCNVGSGQEGHRPQHLASMLAWCFGTGLGDSAEGWSRSCRAVGPWSCGRGSSLHNRTRSGRLWAPPWCSASLAPCTFGRAGPWIRGAAFPTTSPGLSSQHLPLALASGAAGGVCKERGWGDLARAAVHLSAGLHMRRPPTCRDRAPLLDLSSQACSAHPGIEGEGLQGLGLLLSSPDRRRAWAA